LKRGPDVPPIDVTTPPITSERRLTVHDTVELPRIYMAWLTPPFFKAGDAEADLAANLLGGDKVSRLYKSLVYEKQIAQEVYAYQGSNMLASVFMVVATAAPGHPLEELEKEIQAQLAGLRTTVPDAAEVAGAKRSIENSILFSLERNGSLNGIADRINGYNHYVKDPGYLQQDVARYRNATPEGIRDFAAQYLTDSSRVVVYAVPGEKKLAPPVPRVAAGKAGVESINADEEWRHQPPQPGPVPALVLPAAESFKLSNGLTVIFDRREGVPTLAAGLVFKSGSGSNPLDRPGLASFTLGMLDEGTATRSAMQLAEDLKRAGAAITEYPSRDSSSLVLTSARGNVARGFELLADVAMNPSFPADEIERLRKIRLGELVQMKQDPSVIADRAMVLAIAGDANPYGYLTVGTSDGITATTAEDLRSFWKSHMTPSNAALIVSGDFTRSDLEDLAEQAFGTWSAAGPPAPGAMTAFPRSPRIVAVDQPGTPQSQLRLAIAGPARATPDYAPLEVMNMILGGMFSSRVNMNLRETHGYSYGAYSFVRYLQHGGWIAIGAGVQGDTTAPSISEIFKEVGRIRQEPAAPEEMRTARDSLMHSLPAEFETTSQTVSMFVDPFVYDLGLDFYSRWPAMVEAVTESDVQTVAKKYLIPENMLVVVVGDMGKFKPRVEALKLGPIEVRDPEGRPVR
jgi:zinc protease